MYHHLDTVQTKLINHFHLNCLFYFWRFLEVTSIHLLLYVSYTCSKAFSRRVLACAWSKPLHPNSAAPECPLHTSANTQLTLLLPLANSVPIHPLKTSHHRATSTQACFPSFSNLAVLANTKSHKLVSPISHSMSNPTLDKSSSQAAQPRQMKKLLSLS